jgi:DNA primase
LGGPYPPAFVEAVRGAADIVRVVSDYVLLRPAGTRLKGLCPFHQEKTPSFSVDPRNNLFYCFGCQTGGDLFKFVMLYERIGFPEALEMLAQRFGVPIPARTGRSTEAETAVERQVRLLGAAAAWFRTMLVGEAGRRCREYIDRRGLQPETADRLGLGCAPDGWDGALSHLRAAGFKSEEIARAGLVVPRKSGDGFYDRFRDRLMFPIRDVHGRTIAFGGRAVGDGEPKYINSPETPTYTKGDHLYGLDLARDAIRREGFAIVVEGYLDLAALVQAGIEPVVASLGTAFTAAQARLLARHTERVIVCYDGDTAGAKATTRSLDLLLDRKLEVRVVELPGSMDPDEFVRAEGGAAYADLVQRAPEYLEFLVRREVRTRDMDRLDEKVAAVNAVLPHITRLASAVERAGWAGRLADAVGIDDGVVLQELRAAARAGRGERVRTRPPGPPAVRQSETRLVHLLLRSDEERTKLAAEPDPAEIAGSVVAPILTTVLRLTREGLAIDLPSVLDALPTDEDRELLTRIAFLDEPEDGPGAEDCLCSFRREALAREQKAAIRRIGRMQAEPTTETDAAQTDRWLEHVQSLARARDALH